MGDGYMHGGSGPRGFGGGRLGAGQHLTDAFDRLRSMFEPHLGARAGQGDVRSAVLVLLRERPMHGYEVIAEIERRSGGAWHPSAGSVYPTLQLLADEGLIESAVGDGRKTYSLTEAGRAEADTIAGRGGPWDAGGHRDLFGVGPLPKAGVDLAHAVAQVGRTASPEQLEQAVTVLNEARRKLYSILAQD